MKKYLLLALIFFFFVNADKAEAVWYNSSWLYRIPLTLRSGQVGSTTAISGFPVLYSTSSASILKHTDHGGNVGKVDGTDILITASDGITKLPHEIEYFASTTGQLQLWFITSTTTNLSTTTDTTYYMYLGNSGASDQQNITGVWDSNFLAVYHLDEGDSTASEFYKDSTSNANNGTLGDGDGDTVATTTKIDGSINFNGDADYIVGKNVITLGTGNFYLSAWVKPDAIATYQAVIADDNTSNGGYTFGYGNTSGKMIVFDRTTAAILESNTVLNNTAPQYLGFTRTGTNTGTFYYNGSSSGSGTWASTNLNVATTTNIGRRPIPAGPIYHDGEIDEVRISNSSRSASWILTEYLNQQNPNHFLPSGAIEQDVGGVTPKLLEDGWFMLFN